MAGMGGMGGGGTLQALLTEMNGLNKPRGFFSRRIRQFLNIKSKPPPRYRILHMFATNLPTALDAALLRPGSRRPHLQGRLPDEGRPGAHVPGLLRQDPPHGHAAADRSPGDDDAGCHRRQRQGPRQRGRARRLARGPRRGHVGRRAAGPVSAPGRRARAGRVHRARAPRGGDPRGLSRCRPRTSSDGRWRSTSSASNRAATTSASS